MNLKLFAAGIVVVGFIVGILFLRGSEAPEENIQTPVEHADIILTSEGFVPRSVRLERSGTITFSTDAGRPFWPASNLHPDHGIYSEFDPRRPVNADDSWTFRFDRTGEWGYHDHLRSYFTGTIYVVE